MRNRKALILMLSVVCLLVVGIGFAAVTRTLNVSGTITATPSAFDVRFIDGTGYTVSKTNVEGDTAVITNMSLSGKGGECLVWLSIQNQSTDYAAEILRPSFVSEVTSSTGGNTNDVEVQFDSLSFEDDKITLAPNESANILVLATLLKAQIETETFSFTITFTANAIVA